MTPAEIDKPIAVAKHGCYGQRDATLILVAYRHGLRAIEVADLEWSQVEWNGMCCGLLLGPVLRGRPQEGRSAAEMRSRQVNQAHHLMIGAVDSETII